MKINIAIAGNPNSGKTTLFNCLAGTNYRVANYPGVTVEKKSGIVKFKGSVLNFTDLPGTYSLSTYSLEEKVARNFILDEKPDIILQVLDASNLERNLYLTVQLLELNVPVIIALNMVDVANKRSINIDTKLLSQRLGVPIIDTIARKGDGRKNLLEAIHNYSPSEKQLGIKDFSYSPDVDNALLEMVKEVEKNELQVKEFIPKYIALKFLERDDQITTLVKKDGLASEKFLEIANKVQEHTKKTLNTDVEFVVSDYRYGIVSSLLKGIVTQKVSNIDRMFLSDKIDKVLTHRIVGPIFLLSILYFSYQFTFWASETPIAWLESFFGYLSSLADANLSDGLLKSLIISGIIDGAGGVLGFTPLIMFMFLMIAVLEDTGYMARIAYVLDRVFRYFGLQGSSALPYIVSGGIAGGCAVPGVMATRTIKGHKERLLTMLTAPFMVCGAKLPVLSLLIAAFFPGKEALLLLLFTMVGWISALLLAKLFGKTIVKGESASFLMELPPYRLPTLKGLALHSWEKTWMYIKKAGTIILAISAIFWALMTFPNLPTSETNKYETQREMARVQFSAEVVSELENLKEDVKLSEEATALKKDLFLINNRESQAALKYSLAGTIGSFLEPVTKYAGFDWRTNIALLGGIVAKEVVVSALGTAYSMGEVDLDDSQALSDRLAKDPAWNIGVAISLILFMLFYAPCFVTVVVIVKESGSWKWGTFTAISYTLFAFLLSILFYSGYNAFLAGIITVEKIILGGILGTAVTYLTVLFWKKLSFFTSKQGGSPVCGGCPSTGCGDEELSKS